MDHKPPLASGIDRGRMFSLRLTTNEHAIISAAAKIDDRPLSALVRLAALARANEILEKAKSK